MCALELQGEENLGIAMTFTLVTLLKEVLLEVLKNRLERKRRDEAEEERRQIEVSGASC